MYGDPLKRIGKPLKYVEEGKDLVAYDGNGNPAGKINRTTFKAVYSTPSIRLSAGPKTTFLYLGTYNSLEDAKHVLELQEHARAVPVFAPGRILGWTNPDRTIDVKDPKGFWSRLWSFIKKIFSFKKALT
ncbi:hypothetical protein [Alteromonas sp.]|uniref:hypothetical protein n=1 Tax=Alteromonas sp. TaxID=232 RepID=UPI000C4CF6E5|nr:hypothetical protein [Alteromonas sp.]MAI39220.1 hypothetical protein [Alteromonas sp.]|tara:strand:- start:277 stop:666 length:390 start_codon:yes stop_codon:yes gene_type:complete